MTASAEAIKTEWSVTIVRLGSLTKHPNADTLSIVDVHGYPVIVRTEDFHEGQLAVYIPVDSVVPVNRPEFEFLRVGDKPTARIKARRLRGVFSMGLLIPVPEAAKAYDEGNDVAEVLGITKYVPPSEARALAHESRMGRVRKARYERVKLPVYGLDPLRRYSHVFNEGESVVITEKIHGANARYVYLKGRLHVGSHKTMRGATRHRFVEWLERVKLKALSLLGVKHRAHTLAAVGDIWWEIAEKYGLKERLVKKPGYVLYGEIYGQGVQDLTYDAPNERKFRAFDVYDLKAGRFLDWMAFLRFVEEVGLDPRRDIVPFIDHRDWCSATERFVKDVANTARSTLSEHIIEGVVVKPLTERHDPRVGRVAMKFVGEQYLLRKDA